MIEEKPNSAELIKREPNEIEITDENLNEILDSGFIDNTSTINEQFFTGGDNWYFDQSVKMFRNQSNEMFVNFLQTNVCMELMRKNKIKIHISSGDIYINNINTNESIYSFLAVQNNPSYIIIDKEFIFDGSLNAYYNTYLSNSLLVKDDFSTNRNSKFLFLHFNNVLQMTGVTPYKLRHTVVIKNEKALELVQKSNWQYFISTLMNIATSNLLGSSEYTEEEENEIRPYIDNIISHGEMYKDIYTTIALSFHTVFENLPLDELKKLYQDLNDNEIYQDLDEVTPEELLDIFLEFYYFHGRFPGENRLIVLPSFNIPREISNSSIDLSALFLDFRNTYFQPLASIQGICALTKYVSTEYDNKKLDGLIKNTIEEFFRNLLENNLNLNNTGEISYENITELMNVTVKNLNNINETINHKRNIVNEEINSRINQYENDQVQDIKDDFKSQVETFSSQENNQEKSFEEDVKLKKEDYVDQLNKFLLEIQPGIEGIRQLNSEDKQKILLDVENPHVKIEQTFNQSDENNISRVEEENIVYNSNNVPKVEFNKPKIIVPVKLGDDDDIDGINSNTNLIKKEEDNFMNTDTITIEGDDRDSIINVDSDDDDQKNIIQFGVGKNKKLLDVDQSDGENLKIEIDDTNDENLNLSLKREKTELGFFPEQPHKDNLGEQQIKIEDDDDITEYKKEDPEMDTNFERSIPILPTSHSLNILRKIKIKPEQNEIKPKKSKRNYQDMTLEEYKAKVDDFIKKNPPKLEIPELDTNYERPLFVLPTSHSKNLIKKEVKKEKNSSKKQLKKNNQDNMSREEYKTKVNDYFKKETGGDYFFESNKNDVEFLKQRPVHPRDRLRRIKKEVKKEILPTSHSLNLVKKKEAVKKKRKRKTTTTAAARVPKKITKKIKQELIDEYFNDQQNNVKFVTQKPVHPRNRKIKSQPKIRVDKSAKKYLNLNEFDIKFNNIQNLPKNDRVEYIFDQLISKLPQDNNEFSIKYDPKTDTFTIYRDV